MDRLEVKQEKVKVLNVTVIRATGVSVKGWFENGFAIIWRFITSLLITVWPSLGEICKRFTPRPIETPDPYVMLRVRTSPNARQYTSTKGNDVNPKWNETFTFYLNPEQKNTLELIMMDEDFGFDDKVGKKEIDVDGLPLNANVTKNVPFNETTTLEISMVVTYDETNELRFSYDLCDEEKQFLKMRKATMLKKFSKLGLKDETPKNENEVPVIAIMGSGGGYRAACGLSGVFVALQEAGVLDCATYVSGLSGSSWYISSLFMHEGWPDDITCQDMADDLKKRFNTSLFSHFHFDFKRRLDEKARTGQPVRLTDFFGMAIGDALLPNQQSRLSFQDMKVKHGEVALPILTGIRVRKDMSADAFNEWVEFTPFEYGSAKYGVFGKTKDFGSKYYKGRLVKTFNESPLHYLQGIWGSAFSIILNTLKSRGGKKSETQAQKDIVDGVLKDAQNVKGEEQDSEDEELPEDEVPNEYWVAEMLNPVNVFSSRRGKAAETFNFCRGLKFTSKKDSSYEDTATGKDKTICVVDSGIAFNSPYPALLRPERKIELILSFDFSQRDGGDKDPPFKEILKAEQWAKDHGLPFPQIKGNPVLEDPVMRECYLFENKDDINCPMILHFPLVNKSFRQFVKPGVPRKTKEEKEFGNFDIFDDPDEPYSSFNFEYEPRTFSRLHELMKFNTQLNMALIKEKIAYYVGYRRQNPDYA